jgi:hypothetical protein
MKEVKIIVCAKQIPDPEVPFSNVSVNVEKKEVLVDAPDVISPYDENALKDNGFEHGKEGLGYCTEKDDSGRR